VAEVMQGKLASGRFDVAYKEGFQTNGTNSALEQKAQVVNKR